MLFIQKNYTIYIKEWWLLILQFKQCKLGSFSVKYSSIHENKKRDTLKLLYEKLQTKI